MVNVRILCDDRFDPDLTYTIEGETVGNDSGAACEKGKIDRNKLYSVQLIGDVHGYVIGTYNFWHLEDALIKMKELSPIWKFEIHVDNEARTVWYGK